MANYDMTLQDDHYQDFEKHERKADRTQQEFFEMFFKKLQFIIDNTSKLSDNVFLNDVPHI
jgi:hypothetical protein